jgi:hypothetical protein
MIRMSNISAPDAKKYLRHYGVSFDEAALSDVDLTGAEPVLSSSFAVGTVA